MMTIPPWADDTQGPASMSRHTNNWDKCFVQLSWLRNSHYLPLASIYLYSKYDFNITDLAGNKISDFFYFINVYTIRLILHFSFLENV